MSNIKIGSWNLQNFAATTKKNINIVVEAILKFDLIALQEIRDKKGVEILVEKTGYNYWLSEPVGSSETTAHQTGKRKERYAFLWNNKIKCLQEPLLIKGNKHFVRSPAIGFFSSILQPFSHPLSSFSQGEKNSNKEEKGGFDFVLSTIHVVWGQKRDREAELKSIKKVLKEMRKVCMLTSSLSQSFSPCEKNIILCGDFNTNLNNENEIDWFTCIKEGTVIKSSNCYDNFWISKETIEFLEAGVEKVSWSDHYPIYAKFSCGIDCDDLDEINLDLEIN